MDILIVEDNPQMRRVLSDFAKGLVENIYECDDGSEAFALYEAHRPDWVLMDIQMREMDGISATRQIIAAFPDAKIAIVTNHDDDDLREAAHAAGAREYIVKERLMEVRRILNT